MAVSGLRFYSIAVIALGAGMFTGCSSTALSPGKSVLDVQSARDSSALANVSAGSTVLATHPSGFSWAGQTLRATGEGTAPEGMPRAQRDIAATNSASANAKANLKTQIKALPVGTDQTVGSIMGTYSPIRIAIERELEAAPIVRSGAGAGGNTTAEVEMPMDKVAGILQQHRITTDQELPTTDDPTPVGVSNVI